MAYVKAQPREMSGRKATIYWVGPLGALPCEVAEWRVKVQPVSFDGVRMERPCIEYRAPKKRTWERAPVERKSVSLLVLDGWGHGGPKVFEEGRTSGGFVSQSSLYATFDSRWASDYQAWADEYIARHASADDASVTVLADYRGWGEA